MNIPQINWPARSLDLNPIEHVWDMLGRRARAFFTGSDFRRMRAGNPRNDPKSSREYTPKDRDLWKKHLLLGDIFVYFYYNYL